MKIPDGPYFEHPEKVQELKALLEQSKLSGRSRP